MSCPGSQNKQFTIPADDTVLLSECSVTTYRSRGKGGQHVNTTDSAVRLRHRKTGIVVTCQRERSQYLNKMTCLKNLRKRLEKLCTPPPVRIATKVPPKERLKRRENKTRLSQKKKLRTDKDFLIE